MLASPESSLPNPAKEKFDLLLKNIYSHPFVTAETTSKRIKLNEAYQRIRDTFRTKGVDRVVCFPGGSIGAGMAVADSDLDARIFYDGPKSLLKEKEIIALVASPELSGIILLPFTDALSISPLQIAYGRITRSPEGLSETATLFSPSLNEMTDINEKKIVDEWRVKILHNLSEISGGQAAWNLIREYLDRNFIHYEKNITGQSPAKRKRRVEEVIESRLRDRFPNDEGKQTRTYQFIQSLRAKVKFPDYEEMLIAFGILNKHAL